MEILDASEQISEPQGIFCELKAKEKAIAWYGKNKSMV
jgi:hypothetical protein